MRRRTGSSNNQTQQSTASGSQSTVSQPATNGSNRGGSNGGGQPTHRTANNAISQSNQNRSGLPATSGALLRARRRSEINQQIHRDLSNDDTS